MKEVEYHEIERWGWECPVCYGWNEEEEDPDYTDTVVCQDCEEEFIPIRG